MQNLSDLKYSQTNYGSQDVAAQMAAAASYAPANQPPFENGAPNGLQDAGTLEQRINRLESMLGLGLVATADAGDDFDDLFNLDGDTPTQGNAASAEPAAQQASGKGCPNVCLSLWGGPIMPADNQSLWYGARALQRRRRRREWRETTRSRVGSLRECALAWMHAYRLFPAIWSFRLPSLALPDVPPFPPSYCRPHSLPLAQDLGRELLRRRHHSPWDKPGARVARTCARAHTPMHTLSHTHTHPPTHPL